MARSRYADFYRADSYSEPSGQVKMLNICQTAGRMVRHVSQGCEVLQPTNIQQDLFNSQAISVVPAGG